MLIPTKFLLSQKNRTVGSYGSYCVVESSIMRIKSTPNVFVTNFWSAVYFLCGFATLYMHIRNQSAYF